MENAGKNIVIYENDSWLVELRPRNNAHANEPDMKVWICRDGQEVAQYTNNYRGYGHYKDEEELLPPEISGFAKKVWEKLKEAPVTDELVEELKGMME